MVRSRSPAPAASDAGVRAGAAIGFWAGMGLGFPMLLVNVSEADLGTNGLTNEEGLEAFIADFMEFVGFFPVPHAVAQREWEPGKGLRRMSNDSHEIPRISLMGQGYD